MLTVNTLSTPNLILRPMTLDDKDYLSTLQYSHGYKEDRDMENLSMLFIVNSCGWIVEDRQFRVPLGTVYYTEVMPGIMANIHPIIDRIAVKDRGLTDSNGLKVRVMEEATTITLTYMLLRFNLIRIGATFRAINSGAIGFIKRLGFKREGTLRHALLVNGEPMDMIILSKLDHEIRRDTEKLMKETGVGKLVANVAHSTASDPAYGEPPKTQLQSLQEVK